MRALVGLGVWTMGLAQKPGPIGLLVYVVKAQHPALHPTYMLLNYVRNKYDFLTINWRESW
jgi:hypothetical protein